MEKRGEKECYSDCSHMSGFRQCYGKFNDSGHVSESSTRNGSVPITTEQHEKRRFKMSGVL